MRILYIASNPDDAVPIQSEREISALQRRLDEARSTEPIELRAYPALDVEDLSQVISRTQPDVIHFAAHGDGDSIVLTTADGERVELGGEDLADLLEAIAVRPKLVVLNACSSAAMARAVARAADFTIGTDAPITNSGACTMAATLYGRLADSASIHAAFKASDAMLRIVGRGKVQSRLFPEDGHAAADRTRLTEPLRILASLPAVEQWLEDGADKPKRGFDPSEVEVQFGVVGAPASATQLQLFTDDETVVPRRGRSLEEARSWIVETRAVRGEIWIEPWYAYYGDMQWYASIATADRRIIGAAASTCEAIERYYLLERWRFDLPPRIAETVRLVIDELRRHEGARRGHPSPVTSAFLKPMRATTSSNPSSAPDKSREGEEG